MFCMQNACMALFIIFQCLIMPLQAASLIIIDWEDVKNSLIEGAKC